MKKMLLSFVVIATLTASCVTNRVITIPNSSTISNLEKDRIEVLGKTEGKSGGGRVWLLFIPIGWAKDSWCEGRAYKKALKSYSNADGLLEQTETYHKTVIPLIVVTPVVKKVKITGIAYHIRTDEELEEYLKTKKK
ncbi:hypothetical protein [Fluviicola sp.]|jgi:hypothetical protein|uniref:hypothetical protein n=1 Tax=Fluviicola sp. TaxID=1917219 RepID=UPI00282C20BC|nr:hypothetical protein [Fluviicola sp.]MDR0803355.1 hypothetical protein [Fluviicola sp.]